MSRIGQRFIDQIAQTKLGPNIARLKATLFPRQKPRYSGVMTNHLHISDLPDGLELGTEVAIDCETMGLHPHRDRLCVVQLSGGDGHSHIVQIKKGQTEAPNLCAILENPDVLKLFHFGRFDIAAMQNAFGAITSPVYCTKIASRLIRTYTDRH